MYIYIYLYMYIYILFLYSALFLLPFQHCPLAGIIYDQLTAPSWERPTAKLICI